MKDQTVLGLLSRVVMRALNTVTHHVEGAFGEGPNESVSVFRPATHTEILAPGRALDRGLGTLLTNTKGRLIAVYRTFGTNQVGTIYSYDESPASGDEPARPGQT